MKIVMTKAWEIAKAGHKRFGGKVTDYLAEAMRLAWAYYKHVGDDKQLLDRLNKKLAQMWTDKKAMLEPKFGTRSVFIKLSVNNTLKFYTLDVSAKIKLGKQLAAAGF